MSPIQSTPDGATTRQRYIAHYTKAVKDFSCDAGDVDAAGIPEVHLPFFGRNYEAAKLRIVFVGRDTRNWGDMAAFLSNAKADISTTIFRNEQELLGLPFKKWTNNFGTSFWDTVMRLLADFNGIANWKELKSGRNDEILQTFVWANTNAVEQWNGVALKRWEKRMSKKADHAAWTRLKAASERRLDSISAILDIFRPHIVIIMNWNLSSGYLDRPMQLEEISKYVRYAVDGTQGAHVFQTAHPTWLSHKKMIGPVLKTIVEKWHTTTGVAYNGE